MIDPSNHEETVSGGRMTVSINTSNDICAVQKAGGEGIMSGVVMQCMRIASMKAADITKEIKNAVSSYKQFLPFILHVNRTQHHLSILSECFHYAAGRIVQL